MKYTALSLLFLVSTVYADNPMNGSTNLNPQQLCPVAEQLYNNYCQDNSTYTCSKLENFINNYCQNVLDTYAGFDPHELCPLVNLIDKLLCGSQFDYSKLNVNPKELCPLFDYVDQKYCQSKVMYFSSGAQEFTCALACKPVSA